MNLRLVRMRGVLILVALILASLFNLPRVDAWGEHGHRISGRAAATDLPVEMPAFFRDAAPQLEYLNPEPDRWRERAFEAMNEAFRYDHYIDLEVVPEVAMDAQDRYAYLAALYKAGVKEPEKSAGLFVIPHSERRLGSTQMEFAKGHHPFRNSRRPHPNAHPGTIFLVGPVRPSDTLGFA